MKKKNSLMAMLILIIIVIIILVSIILRQREQDIVERREINNQEQYTSIDPNQSEIPIPPLIENEQTAGKPFIFDDLEITVGDKYNIVNSKNNTKVVEVPVTVKNPGNIGNSFNISYVQIMDNTGTEVKELGNFFADKSFITSPKLEHGQITTKNIYIPYNGNGQYKMVFKNFEEEKSVKINVKN